MNGANKLVSSLVGIFVSAVVASATPPPVQTLSFNDNVGTASAGTYQTTDTFSVDVYLAYSPYNASNLSYWLEVPTALAPFISITNVSYFTFGIPNSGVAGPATLAFDSISGADTGFLAETRNLGGSSAIPVFSGTVQVTTLTFNLAGAPTGVFSLFSTNVSPMNSLVTDSFSTTHALGQATYAITIVPEPSSWNLLALAGASVAAVAFVRRVRA